MKPNSGSQATNRFEKRNVDLLLNILTAARRSPRCLMGRGSPEKIGEDIAKAGLASRTGIEVKAVEIEASGEGLRKPPTGLTSPLGDVVGVVAKAVVDCPLAGVAQDVVGLLYAFEALLGSLIARIDIGMVLPGEPSIGLLYLGFLGTTLDTEERIVVLSHLFLVIHVHILGVDDLLVLLARTTRGL